MLKMMLVRCIALVFLILPFTRCGAQPFEESIEEGYSQLQPDSPTIDQSVMSGQTVDDFYFPRYGSSRDPGSAWYRVDITTLWPTNLTASVDFYVNGLGMRLLFFYQPPSAPELWVAYLDRNEGLEEYNIPFTSREEFEKHMRNATGLFGLHQRENVGERPSAHRFGFIHLGVLVPNVTEIQERMTHINATILKAINGTWEANSRLADTYGITGASDMAFTQAMIGSGGGFAQLTDGDWGMFPPPTLAQKQASVDFANGDWDCSQVLFVEDPDGNLIEVKPRPLEEGSK